MKKVLIVVFISALSFKCFSQVQAPERRKFNIGISDGIGGSYFFKFIPALDVRYKSINLRVAPQPGEIGGGLSYEILPFSKIYKDAYWIVSAYGSYGKYTQSVYDSTIKNKNPQLDYINSQINYYSAMIMTGAKLYLGGRAYSQFQIGVIHTNSSDLLKYNSSKFTSLYVEFSVGVNLFRNRPKQEEIGVEEE